MQKKKVEGHNDAVLCCHVPTGAKLLVSGGEDGQLCFTDLNTLNNVGRLQQEHGDAVTSVCSSPANEHLVYASAGQSVLSIDLRKGLSSEEAVCDVWRMNQDEINHIAVNRQGSWLAAADDSGEVQVISLQSRDPSGRPAYKTLRRGHSNICSTVAFRQHRPWELISGGLDATVVRWDFNRLRPQQSWNLGAEAAASGGQIFNPPMVHSVAVPDTEDRSLCRLMAVARGDGYISIYDIDSKPPPPAGGGRGGSSSGSGGGSGGGRGKKDSKARQKGGSSGGIKGVDSGSSASGPGGGNAAASAPAAGARALAEAQDAAVSSSSGAAAAGSDTGAASGSETRASGSGAPAEAQAAAEEAQAWQVPFVPGRVCLLGREQGGHTAAVNCLEFQQGSSWQRLLSVGNDGRLLLWDWQAAASRQGSGWTPGGTGGSQERIEGEAAAGAGAGAGEGEGTLGSRGAAAAAADAALEGGSAQVAAGVEREAKGGSTEAGGAGFVLADVRHGRKLNWVCSFEPVGGYNVVLADVTRRMTVLGLH